MSASDPKLHQDIREFILLHKQLSEAQASLRDLRTVVRERSEDLLPRLSQAGLTKCAAMGYTVQITKKARSRPMTAGDAVAYMAQRYHLPDGSAQEILQNLKEQQQAHREYVPLLQCKACKVGQEAPVTVPNTGSAIVVPGPSLARTMDDMYD